VGVVRRGSTQSSRLGGPRLVIGYGMWVIDASPPSAFSCRHNRCREHPSPGGPDMRPFALIAGCATRVGEVGSASAAIDGFDATHCP